MQQSPPVPRCPVCSSHKTAFRAKAKDLEYCTSDEEFTFYDCSGCGSVFIYPMPVERLAEIYPSNYYSFAQSQDSFVHKIKNFLDKRYFSSLFAGLHGDSLAVLDVGGGAGQQLNVLRSVDARVKFTQVVDLDPAAEQLARNNGHEYYCGRIEDFTGDRKFDLVLMLNLIEHVADPLAVLRQVQTLLSPQGLVLIKTPNVDAWDARLFRHKNWGGYHCPRHWVLFTQKSFAEAAQKAGLRVVRWNYTQGAPFWTTSFLFMLQRLGVVSITRERPVVYHPLFPLLNAGFAALDFARGLFAKTSQMFFILGKGE